MRRSLLLASVCSSFCVMGVGSAFAADAPASTGGGIETVTVTAERRVEDVQKTSLAISVHSAIQLKDAGAVQARDLTKLEPGVQIGQGGPATQIYIRGVGDFGSTPITNPAVAFNVDGVYVSRSNSTEGNFFDLQRIEILKGPQGTLYGRNASGGAVNVITNKPSLEGFGGDVDVEVGDYNLIHTEGAVNVPLTDTLAVRGAFQVVSRSGYSSDGFDDDQHQSFRLSGLWQPSDDISLRVTVDHTHVGGNGPAYVFKGPLAPSIAAAVAGMGVLLPTDPRETAIDPSVQQVFYAVSAAGGSCIPNGAIPAKLFTTTVGPGIQGLCPPGFSSLTTAPDKNSAKLDNAFTNVSAEFNWNMGFATLTVLPAYREVRNDYTVFPVLTYLDSTPGHPEKSDTLSLETRLGHAGEQLSWTAGIYLYEEDQDNTTSPGLTPSVAFLAFGLSQTHMLEKTISMAAFGQATYSVTDSWRLIGGIRFTHDRRDINGIATTFNTTPATFPFRIGGPCFTVIVGDCTSDQFIGKKTWDNVTFKVGTEYDLSDQNMLYLTYATGDKAGGFNAASQFGVPGNVAQVYNPEQLKALEVGARNRFFDSTLQVNAEGFYWKYENAQESFASVNAAGSPTFGTTNAASATMYGVDLDVIEQFTPDDTFHVGIEYLNASFDKFVYNSFLLSSLTSGCIITPGVPFQTIDCSGKPLIRAPRWSGSANYMHTFLLDGGASVDANISAQFATSRYLGTEFIPATKAAGYIEGDFVVTYHAANDKWSLTGFVRNFNDARVYTGSFDIPQFVPSYVVANLAPPRTFGARLSVKF